MDAVEDYETNTTVFFSFAEKEREATTTGKVRLSTAYTFERIADPGLRRHTRAASEVHQVRDR